MRSGANWFYAKKFHLPITVICDVVKHGGEHFAIHVSGQQGMLQCRLWSKESSLDRPFNVNVDWIENGDGGKRNATTLSDVKGVALDQPFEKQFRLPLPNVKINESFVFDVSRATGKEPTTISRLEIRGRIAPMFGMEVDERSGTAFAKKVFPNGLAEKAGFQTGDVISAINGKKPQTRTEAIDMLSRLPIGEEAVFTIQRADKTRELRVVAE
jgi:hypothetical protein